MSDVTHISRSAGLQHSPVRSPAVDRALVAVTTVAVLAGVALRFWPRRGLWLDEALSVNIAGLPLGEIPGALERDGHPPLYYLLLHAWTTLGSSDWWVRALSGLITVLGLPLAYLAGARLGARSAARGLGARRCGMLTLALWSVLPFAVRYGAEARMYGLVSTLVLAGYLLIDRLLVDPPGGRSRNLHVAGLVLVTAALLYSHYWSLWLGAATALVVAVIGLRAMDSYERSGAWTTLAALAGGVVLYLPWVPTMLYQSSHTGTPWGEVFRPATVLVVTVTDFVGGGFGEMQIVSYVLVTTVFVAAFGAIRDRAGKQVVELTAVPKARIGAEVSVLLVTMAIGWATSMVASATYASRYAAVVAPLFVLCVAAGLAMFRTRRATWVAAAVICAALVVGSVAEVVSDRTQARVAADEIGADLASGPGEADQGTPVVIACPDQLAPATLRALDNAGVEADVVPFPEGDPRFVDWVDYGERNAAASPSDFVDELLAGVDEDTPVYAVVNPSYRTFEGKCEAVLGELGRDGAEVERLVEGDSDNFFEGMSLWVRRPAN